MKYIIILIAFTITSQSQPIHFFDLHLDKTFKIIEEIMQRGDDLDKLVEYFLDTTKTTTINGAQFYKNKLSVVVHFIKKLKEHIELNKFLNGYIIEKQRLSFSSRPPTENKFGDYKNIQYIFFSIKIRSIATKDIIWFHFDNQENGIWKLEAFDFCNNFRLPDDDTGCDKN